MANPSGGGISPLSLIASPIAGAFQYAGGKAQAKSEKYAADLQFKSTEEALADARQQRQYQQGQYANYLTRLQPYQAVGANAAARLDQTAARALPGAVPTMGSGQLVKLASPTGQIRDVPAAHADWYLSRGATKVS